MIMITYIFLNRIYSLQELAMLLIGDVNLIDDFAILSTDGSCLLFVMSTEISVDIAVDTRSIVGRQSVDTRSTLG